MLSLLARVCWFVDFQPGRQLFVMPAQNVWRGIKKTLANRGLSVDRHVSEGKSKMTTFIACLILMLTQR